MDETTVLSDIALRFNIKHPSLEEAYSYGYDCACAEIRETDNPFIQGTLEYNAWCEGWWAGFYGEQPLFDCPLTTDRVASGTPSSANDHHYPEQVDSFFVKFLEISGVLVISAIVGYQLFELVA